MSALKSSGVLAGPLVLFVVSGLLFGEERGDHLVPGKSVHAHGIGAECLVNDDFGIRDVLPQTDRHVEKWNTKWGPPAKTYLVFEVPDCVKDPLRYQRKRAIAVAKKYLDLAYKHKHIPAAGGLDCSNFTSWVYNDGFGTRFSSHVGKQAASAGRRLGENETWMPGDLLFQTNKAGNQISHVVIYLGSNQVIDSTKGKVAIRGFRGWYKSRHSHARRIIE